MTYYLFSGGAFTYFCPKHFNSNYMAEGETVVKGPSFREKHSLGVRIWHWCTLIVIAGSATTVLLAKTLFNTKDNITLVQQTLQEKGVTVTDTVAKAVSHEFNDLVWHWHIYFGYALAGLLAFRVIVEFVNPREQKLIPAIKNSVAWLRKPESNKQETKHYVLVKYLYMFFYFALLIQACTGLFMVYSDDVESLREAREVTSDIHSVFMWVILSYIVIHIGGVILAELGGKYKGVVSDMINGGE